MSHINSLSKFFDPQTRGRGLQYFKGDAVVLEERHGHVLEARAYGTEVYTVHLELKPASLGVGCTCPAFADDACKHVWATLLAAESLGELAEFPPGWPTKMILLEPPEDLLNEDLSDEDYEEDVDDEDVGRNVPALYDPPRKGRAVAAQQRLPPWERQLQRAREMQVGDAPVIRLGPQRELLFVVAAADYGRPQLQVQLALRERKKNGEWGTPRTHRMDRTPLADLDPANRDALTALAGVSLLSSSHSGYFNYEYAGFSCPLSAVPRILPLLGGTGRLYLRAATDWHSCGHPVRWDDGPPWRLEVTATRQIGQYVLTGALRRGEESLPLTSVDQFLPGLVAIKDTLALFDYAAASGWLEILRDDKPVKVPAKDAPKLRRMLADFPADVLNLPAELKLAEIRAPLTPVLLVQKPRYLPERTLEGRVIFRYGDHDLPLAAAIALRPVKDDQAIIRDVEGERAALDRLLAHGLVPKDRYGVPAVEFPAKQLSKYVVELTRAGWRVEVDGKICRNAGPISIEVESGIDWFDVKASVSYEGQLVALPRLLAALRKGETQITLDDGSQGLIPEEWLKRYGLLAGMGTEEDGKLRFRKHQAGLLDALLAEQPEARFDEAFEQARRELAHFDGIQPTDPAPAFQGELRPYQKLGLGWLQFLERFGLGGCLADDMGLGKTVQVLAHLAERRQGGRPPALVVVPKSLLFNWRQEAERFTPQLKVLTHHGVDRAKANDGFARHDLVLTTYGTLRRDILLFQDFRFDYCILDESQAIKNAASDSAKAVRILKGDHRLALSGTPIENHLGELWSLFEFLNPGMLGGASLFQTIGRSPTEESRRLLARGLRPFLLRRTKEQVARDLPEKTEQTLWCDLEPEQRQLYVELRDHYRQNLLGQLDEAGLKKAKIQVLEALLRLRQAACHPGLIDKKRVGEAGAKLEILLPQLEEVIEEGHKALVFSQFTSLLAIVRARLDDRKIPYEYLDGKTRNRQAPVERFQNDPACPLFLVSLKAGGVGLNLTAAEYVFLLDPWWNPAVEAQAIDRTHRIGQTKPVFAYRLIARDTVEEKVLELQKKKRDLADAILAAEGGLIKDLTRDDLELLLS